VEVDIMPSDHRQSPLRAIVYARYSSDHQRDASIEDQIRECRAFIERQGWDYQHAYVDRALSGASTVRPGYQLMLEGARERQFDVAVAEALDRFSRDQEDIAALCKRLRFAGISLVTLADGEITDLHVGLKGTMNALYLKDLADKTRRGLRGRVEAGSSGGGISYGYDIVRKAGPDGIPVLKEELLALETRQEQLEAEIAAAPDAHQPLMHPNLAETYRRKVAALAEALADDAMRDEAFELIRSLLDKIVLVPEGEELRIEIHGELAGILELCHQS
jgi:DNA invertase Pin-like site-specific DNA recombinase